VAFDFLGTFSTGQYLELERFLGIQERDIQKRINYLQGEIRRTGGLVVIFDSSTGYIEKIEASSDKSLVGKLFNAYILQGGNPVNELPIRSFDDPVYLHQGSSTSSVTEYSNKRIIRNAFRFDTYPSSFISNLKTWVLDVIKFKREDLEFKLKKLVDWTDQCAFEIAMLELVGGITIDDEPSMEGKVAVGGEEIAQAGMQKILEVAVESPLKRMIVLTDLSDMLETVLAEVRSGDHPSITNNDEDVFGLGAGKIMESMPLREGEKDPIAVLE